VTDVALTADLLHGIERLDPLPITAQRLVRALNDERIGPAQVAEYIEYDPAVAASVLRLANSAAWAGSMPTGTVRDAVVRLGAAKLLDIVLGDHLRQLKVRAPLYDLAENDLWIHSAAASLAVKALQREKPKANIPDTASTAALVHDIGKLVMVRYMKADVNAILAVRNQRNISFVEAERALFGCDHAEVGAAMGKRWGFPDDIVGAIEHHHKAPIADPTPTIDAVVVANLVAKAIGTGLGAEGMDLRLDERFHRRLRLDFAGFCRVCVQTMSWLKELKASYGVA
jgi:putative nucleotidyltransferase with HDIG domain